MYVCMMIYLQDGNFSDTTGLAGAVDDCGVIGQARARGGLSIRYNVVLCRVREEDAGLSIRRGWFSKAADAGQGTTGEGRQARSKQGWKDEQAGKQEASKQECG